MYVETAKNHMFVEQSRAKCLWKQPRAFNVYGNSQEPNVCNLNSLKKKKSVETGINQNPKVWGNGQELNDHDNSQELTFMKTAKNQMFVETAMSYVQEPDV